MRLTVMILCFACVATRASAQASSPSAPGTSFGGFRHVSWRISVADATPRLIPSFALAADWIEQAAAQPVHKRAVEHSDAYRTRARIHKEASVATLPLFATELALGESLYNTPTAGGKRTAHAIVGGSIAGLFALNTVTGAWNLFGEGRRDPDGRTVRLVHGLLMMAADVGILATTVTGPGGRSQREPLTFAAKAATHRNIAVASISVGTVGYLLMIFKGH